MQQKVKKRRGEVEARKTNNKDLEKKSLIVS
jgi:hypothetical protein